MRAGELAEIGEPHCWEGRWGLLLEMRTLLGQQ